MTAGETDQIEAAFARLSESFVRALRDAATAEGLDAEMSARITQQMILGSVGLLRQSGQSPADLVKQVASKGGTTEAGLAVMNAPDGIDTILARALSIAVRS